MTDMADTAWMRRDHDAATVAQPAGEMTIGAPRHGRYWLDFGGRRMRCAVGRNGIARCKVEGDGMTPAGRFALRRLLYRADRVRAPITKLPATALRPCDGWCDDPRHAAYNRLVAHPFDGSAEQLWRDDRLYDLLVVIGFNDRPVVAGRGSAIFLHLAAPGYAATDGCIAIAPEDLVRILANVDRSTTLCVAAP